MIVVDTNVIAYFLIPGNVSAMAESVRLQDSAWCAPRLWRSEMRNLLLIYLRNGTASLSDIKTLMEDAEALLSGLEFEVDSAGVLELAASSGCTAYDCEFVYVAEMLGVSLVTADKKILAAFPAISVSMTDFVR